jgi:molybdopterin molybdotransferase
MLRIEDALHEILSNVPELKSEAVPLGDALGRTLRQDVVSDIDLPPFDRARMDGYAVVSDDLASASPDSGVTLRAIGEAAAGNPFLETVRKGETVRIMTGAPLPAGADAVEKIEVINVLSADKVEFHTPVKHLQFVTPRASEARAGELMVASGERISPAIAAVLASFGCAHPLVSRRPAIALLSTGTELVDVTATPGPSQIRNSNTFSLGGYSLATGCQLSYSGVIKDDLRATCDEVSLRLQSADVVMLSGGVSMGDYDLVKPALLELGAEIFVERVAMHPGKPTVFAKLGDKVIFGLPGNPVSVAVAFHIFVRPALLKMQGAREIHLAVIRAETSREVKGAPPRRSHQPGSVRFEDTRVIVDPLKWGGSSDLVAFMRANCLIVVPEDRDRILSGEIAEVILLPVNGGAVTHV